MLRTLLSRSTQAAAGQRHSHHARAPRRGVHTIAGALLSGVLLAAPALGGTWTKLTNLAPGPVAHFMLLSDGSVLCFKNDALSTIYGACYKLTPSASGSYVNGTWSTVASMNDTRLYFSSAVLTNGRVLVAGGEYGTGAARGEVYNPVTNVWTPAPIPTSVLDPNALSPIFASQNQFISDANCKILANGNVLITPVGPKTYGGTIIYQPASNTWITGPTLYRGAYQDEASWTKLPDDTIVTIDPFGTNSERYNPATNSWIDDGIVPVALYDPYGSEMGASILLPNGKAFHVGATGKTVLYTPSGSTAPGTWTQAASLPNNRGQPDGPAVPLVDGKLLYAVSAVPTNANHFPSPTYFYEYNYLTNTWTQVNGPLGTTDSGSCSNRAFLCLPDGRALYTRYGNDLYVYTPSGAPIASGKPIINSITPNADGTYHLVGLNLNGISEGAQYGDDAQMDTNFPLVRLTSGGVVRYCRTFNWSCTGVQTGNKLVSTEFALPAGIPLGTYTLEVVTNGFASDPQSFSVAALVPPALASVTFAPVPCVGASQTITANFTGTAPMSFAWTRNNVAISNADPRFTISSTPSAAQLTINGLIASDHGAVYACTATNVFGSASGSATTTPIDPPSISVHPAATTACRGASASFTVQAVGGGTLQYQWRAAGTPIDTLANPTAGTSTLQLTGVTQADYVSYDCVVTNACSSATSNPAALSLGVCRCNPADIALGDGTPGFDGLLTGSDVLLFFQSFFSDCTTPGAIPCNPADIALGDGTPGSDGLLTGSDVLLFFQSFFSSCH